MKLNLLNLETPVVPFSKKTVASIYNAKPLPPLPPLTEFSDPAWYQVLPHLLRCCSRILCVGPTSVGKSTTMMIECGIEHRITMHRGLNEDMIIGSKTLENGNVLWIPGAGQVCMEQGKVLLIDEVDLMPPPVEGIFYGLIDSHPHLTLANGKTVFPISGYKVVMTSNEPPSALPQPLQNRIDCILYCDVPHPDSFPQECSPAEKELTYRMYRQEERPRIIVRPTPRKWTAFYNLLNANIPRKIAAKAVFCDSAEEIASAVANIHASLNR